MKTLLKRFVLDRKRHALRQQLEHVYQERVNGQLLEKHLVARIGRIDVLAERARQVTAEGWTPKHDDGYAQSELVMAAVCYAYHAARGEASANIWPWLLERWKPTTPRRNLIKAGALILAEIERIDRAATTSTKDA
jgi:hypothetical protein